MPMLVLGIERYIYVVTVPIPIPIPNSIAAIIRKAMIRTMGFCLVLRLGSSVCPLCRNAYSSLLMWHISLSFVLASIIRETEYTRFLPFLVSSSDSP